GLWRMRTCITVAQDRDRRAGPVGNADGNLVSAALARRQSSLGRGQGCFRGQGIARVGGVGRLNGAADQAGQAQCNQGLVSSLHRMSPYLQAESGVLSYYF